MSNRIVVVAPPFCGVLFVSMMLISTGKALQGQVGGPTLEVSTGNHNEIDAISFSPSHNKVLSVSLDEAAVWDAGTGFPIRHFDTDKVAFCGDDTVVTNKSTTRLVNIQTGKGQTLPIPKLYSNLLACDPNGTAIASFNSPSELDVISLPDANLRKIATSKQRLRKLRFVSATTIIGWNDTSTIAYDITDNHLISRKLDDADAKLMSVTKIGKDLVGAVLRKSDSKLFIRNLESGQDVASVVCSPCLDVQFDGSSTRFVTLEKAGTSSRIHEFAIPGGRLVQEMSDVNPLARVIAVDQSATLVAVGSGSGISHPDLPRNYSGVEVFSLAGAGVVSMLKGDVFGTTAISVFADRSFITSGESTVHFWDGDLGDIARTVSVAENTTASLDSDGRFLVVAPEKGGILVADLTSSGSVISNSEAHPVGPTAVTSDGKTFAWVEKEESSEETSYVVHVGFSDLKGTYKAGCSDKDGYPRLFFSADSKTLATWCEHARTPFESLLAQSSQGKEEQVCVSSTLSKPLTSKCEYLGEDSVVLGFGYLGKSLVVGEAPESKGDKPYLKTLDASSLVALSSTQIETIPSAMVFDRYEQQFEIIYDDRIDIYQSKSDPLSVDHSIKGDFADTVAAACDLFGVVFLVQDSGIVRMVNSHTDSILGDLITFEYDRNWVFVSSTGAFEGTGEAMKWVGWRSASNDFYPLDYLFGDFYTPMALTKAIRGETSRPTTKDLFSALQIPGLKVMVESGAAEIVPGDDSWTLCVNQEPSSLGYYADGQATGWDASNFVEDSTNPNCRYKAILDKQKSWEIANPADTASFSSGSLKTPWDSQRVASPQGSHLRVLLVGVEHLPNDRLLPELKSATDSVERLKKAIDSMRLRSSSPDRITVDVLEDSQVTAKAIRASFSSLEEKTQRDDTVLVYLVGHGSVPAGQEMYYYMPTDGVSTSLAALRTSAISSVDFADLLKRLQSRRIVFVVDSCQSGGALDSLVRVLKGVRDAEEMDSHYQPRSN